MQRLNWDDLRFLLAVARARSFAGAARQLGVNQTTVGRRIAAAETRLGARLFDRHLGALQLTEAGRLALANAERIELDVQELERAVAGADGLVAGSVRLTSVPIVVNRIFTPALAPLLRAHPQLRVELIAEPRTLSLTRREADIALRLARPHKDLRAVTRRLGRLDYAVYGPAGQPHRGLPWIDYDDSMADLPQSRWLAQRLSQRREPLAAVAVNDAETLLQGIKAGLGKALLPTVVGDREPGLVRLNDGEPVGFTRELWLIVHPDLRRLARVRVVMDWLAEVVNAGPSAAAATGCGQAAAEV